MEIDRLVYYIIGFIVLVIIILFMGHQLAAGNSSSAIGKLFGVGKTALGTSTTQP